MEIVSPRLRPGLVMENRYFTKQTEAARLPVPRAFTLMEFIVENVTHPVHRVQLRERVLLAKMDSR